MWAYDRDSSKTHLVLCFTVNLTIFVLDFDERSFCVEAVFGKAHTRAIGMS